MTRTRSRLRQNPSIGFTLCVLRASGLRRADFSSGLLSDPFAIVKQNGREVHRTSVQAKTLDPEWQDTGTVLTVFRPGVSNDAGQTEVVIELWDADELVDKGDFLGEASIRRVDFLDSTLLGKERTYKLREKQAALSPVGVKGSVVVKWWQAERTDRFEEEVVADALAEAILGDEARLNDDALVADFPFVLCLTRISVTGLPETEVGASLGVAKQDLYIRAMIGDRVTTSTVLASAGRQGVWGPGEVLKLPAKTAWLQEALHGKELELAVLNANHPLPDVLVGECQIHVLARWAAADRDYARELTLPLSRPNKGECGSITLHLTVRQRRAGRSASTVKSAADEERCMVLSALKRSAKLAMLAAQKAEKALEHGADAASRANLRAATVKCRREADHAKRRLRAAEALAVTAFVKRAERRLDVLEVAEGRRARRQAAVRAAAAERDAAEADAAALKAAAYLQKQREYCHVQVTVEVNANRPLGIVWGNVDEEEVKSLEAGHSGYGPDTSLHKEIILLRSTSQREPRRKSTWMKKNRRSTKDVRIVERGEATTEDEEEEDALERIRGNVKALEAEVNRVDVSLQAFTSALRTRARMAASAAGHDLAVASVPTGTQAAKLGVRAGWRAIAMDDSPLTSREQLENALAELKAHLENENGAITRRSTVLVTFAKRVVFRAERERLRQYRRTIVNLQVEKSKKQFSQSMRKKRISVDPQNTLGITWSRASVKSPGGVAEQVLEVVKVESRTTADLYGVRGGWILTHVAGAPVTTQKDLDEAMRNLCATKVERVDLDFLVPRGVHKRLIIFDARVAFGVTKWGDNNAVREIAPETQASKARVREGWILLSLNGEVVSGPPAEALAQLRREARNPKSSLGSSEKARSCPAVFNAASDDVRHVRFDPTIPSNIEWKLVKRGILARGEEEDEQNSVEKDEMSDEEDLVVHKVDNDVVKAPRPGWRLIEIRSDRGTLQAKTGHDVDAAFKAAKKKGKLFLDLTFDASDEEPDLEAEVRAEQDRAQAEMMINPKDLPVLPLVEPCVFLHVVRGVDLANFGRPPYVRVVWCNLEVGRTSHGEIDSTGQPFWKRGTESFLLPMPQYKSPAILGRDGDADDQRPPPMISGEANDVELRLEVWTTRPAPFGPICHGQVLLEGSDLLRQCYKLENDERAKRPMAFKLMSHLRKNEEPTKRGGLVSHGMDKLGLDAGRLFGKARSRPVEGSLKIMVFLLYPRNLEAERVATEAAALKQSEQDQRRRESSLVAKQLVQGPIEAETSSVMTRIEHGSAQERRTAIMRFAELALSGKDDVADVLVARGAAPLISALLAQRSTPADRRDGAAACRGILRDGNETTRQTLLEAGVLPALSKLIRSRDHNLSDASHEALAALAELADRGNTRHEMQVLRECMTRFAQNNHDTDENEEDDLVDRAYSKRIVELLRIGGGGGDCGEETDDEDDVVEHVPKAVVEEILRTCGWTDFLDVLSHGASRTKLEAARILAAIAGTDVGASELSAETVSSKDIDVSKAESNSNPIQALLRVINSGPNNSSRVKADCLRALTRIVVHPDDEIFKARERYQISPFC
ncbi:hypothetical protein CTAYLR_007448 [Chrysophaeum taylorii]|uniref:C2 domain-containing protein n=1 Tax=Chrysophaeum taylorii TaxID=2483200 RepID=A0AAD7UC30_9STRA|nr:hypothetical protein CTAYLR_007448 [Chrysophaeum taylorii]